MNRYITIIRLSHWIKKTKQKFCYRCHGKNLCKWFKAPASKSTYKRIGNVWRVIHTFDELAKHPCCRNITPDYTKKIHSLIEILNKEENEHE